MGSFGANPSGATTFGIGGSGSSNPYQRLGYIYDEARALLVGNSSDTSVFSNAVLQSYFNLAYPELWQCMASVGTPRIKREFYYVLPAYTSYLDPMSIPVRDVEEPELMWERQSVLTIPITSTDISTPIKVTTSIAHGLGTNTEVDIVGVNNTQAPNGRWFITVVDAYNFTLNGSVSDGNAGVGGTLQIPSNSQFTMVQCVNNLDENREINAKLLTYQWEDNVFKFIGATSTAQIKVSYWASAAPPSNPDTQLNIGECQPYLAHRVAGLAAAGKGWTSRSAELNGAALGPKGVADGSGGLLRGFLGYQIQGLQRTTYRRLPYGTNENGWQWPIYGSASK